MSLKHHVVIVTEDTEKPYHTETEEIATTLDPKEIVRIVSAVMQPTPMVAPTANPYFAKIKLVGRAGEKVIVLPIGKTDVTGFEPGTEFSSAQAATDTLRGYGLIPKAKYNYLYLKLKEACAASVKPDERIVYVEGIAFQYARDAAGMTRD